MSGMFVSSVSFGDDVVVINYGEERRQSPVAGVMETISIDADCVEEEYAELQALAGELVDKGLLMIRNPPKKRRGREMVREFERAVDEGEEEWDDDE